MPDFIRSLPLTGTTVVTVLAAVGVGCLLVLVAAQRPRRDRRTVGRLLWTALVAVAVPAAVTAVAVAALDLTLFEIPVTAVVAGVLLTAALILTGTAVVTRRSRAWWTVFPSVGAVLTTVLLVNAGYGMFPDIGSLHPEPSYRPVAADELPPAVPDAVPVDHWHAPTTLPEYGTLTTLPVPAPSSGFHARDAHVYLPPAWSASPRPQLPVLVLMGGIPGSPEQWISRGHATELAHDYQREHGGLSPIIAVVDATGSTWGDPVCTDSPTAKVRTFLSRDVPDWLLSRFNADPDQSRWTIGGYSYGGLCALQVVANAPDTYGGFLDFSGDRRPTDEHRKHDSTVRDFFDGSEQAYRDANPEHLLHTRSADGRYSRLHGWFIAGHRDRPAVDALHALSSAAERAGVDVSTATPRGGHDFGLWRDALRTTFPDVVRWGGLPQSGQ
jgi:S-formylglutathione hydrolase FrmB